MPNLPAASGWAQAWKDGYLQQCGVPLHSLTTNPNVEVALVARGNLSVDPASVPHQFQAGLSPAEFSRLILQISGPLPARSSTPNHSRRFPWRLLIATATDGISYVAWLTGRSLSGTEHRPSTWQYHAIKA
jgi:hypothetical protein